MAVLQYFWHRDDELDTCLCACRFVSMCNTLLFFTQWKAFVNSLVASVGAKDMTFKAGLQKACSTTGKKHQPQHLNHLCRLVGV